jgi:glutathione peroxidase-family protein
MSRHIPHTAARLSLAAACFAAVLTASRALPSSAGGHGPGHDHATVVSPGHDPANDPDSGVELIGRPAPAFRFDRWVRGGPMKLGDLRGKVVLLRFWTEKCRFCEASLPALEVLRERYGDDGLVVLGAFHPNEPGQDRSDARILEVADSLGFGGPIACDQRWRTLRRYWLDGHPDRNWVSTSFLVDREGVIRWVHGGGEYHETEDPRHARCEVKLHELEAAIEQVLAQGRAVDAPVRDAAR